MNLRISWILIHLCCTLFNCWYNLS
jgi:hypothetical protein